MKSANEQYMTPVRLAKTLVDDFCTVYNKHQYHFIEPCVGTGNFWKCLPNDRRTGIELDHNLASMNQGVSCGDFLDFIPKMNTIPMEKRVVIGNPPFTHCKKSNDNRRLFGSSLAAKFILHALEIADTVAFILPSSFIRQAVRKTTVPVVRARDLGIINFDLLIEGQYAKVRCVWLVISRVLPRTERFHLFDIVNDHFVDPTQSEDFEFLPPYEGHKGNFFMNRWGSVGNVYDKPPPLVRLLRGDGKRHGRGDLQYLWILAKPECLHLLNKTAECIRQYWRSLSAGNNASIGLNDFNCVYNAVKKGDFGITCTSVNKTRRYKPPSSMRGFQRLI
jgi:predicted RNA methylase